MDTLAPQKRGAAPFLLLLFLVGLMVTLFLIMNLRSNPVPLNPTISGWESLDLSIADFIVRSETPEINLTDEQVAEITTLYNDGLEFDDNPNDPCRKLKLTGFKKLNKWINQFKQRGFTVSKIRETLKIGTRSVYNHRSGTNFTRIIHPDGSCIIVDFVDCMIWQIAPAHFRF